jgi:hypothetical protein
MVYGLKLESVISKFPGPIPGFFRKNYPGLEKRADFREITKKLPGLLPGPVVF